MKQQVEIDYNDVFKYVVGDTNRCPLERKLPAQCEAGVGFIYDGEKFWDQETDNYGFFIGNLEMLRMNVRNGAVKGTNEIARISKKIAEIGPIEIFLPNFA